MTSYPIPRPGTADTEIYHVMTKGTEGPGIAMYLPHEINGQRYVDVDIYYGERGRVTLRFTESQALALTEAILDEKKS